MGIEVNLLLCNTGDGKLCFLEGLNGSLQDCFSQRVDFLRTEVQGEP
jgi:hypothetical protein